jgi:hypothetical protein
VHLVGVEGQLFLELISLDVGVGVSPYIFATVENPERGSFDGKAIEKVFF